MGEILSTTVPKIIRRTKTAINQLDSQIIAVLKEDHPQSVRHVFYRMTDPRLTEPVEKSDHGYKQVQKRLTVLRRNGRIPYGYLADATRRGYFTSTFNGSAEFVRRHISNYRADIWKHSDTYLEVWVESRSIAGVVQNDCEELAVSLYPAGGFSSITFAYEAALNINAQFECHGNPVHIIYIGDYDPAGVLIDKAIEREMRAHLDDDIPLTFERLAITEEQVYQYNLPTKPRKESDKRSQHVKYTVEAEAMPAKILRALLRKRVESFLPSSILEICKAVEDDEKRALNIWADIMDKYDAEDLADLLSEDE